MGLLLWSTRENGPPSAGRPIDLVLSFSITVKVTSFDSIFEITLLKTLEQIQIVAVSPPPLSAEHETQIDQQDLA